MTKTPEQMAKQYVEQENLEYEEAAGSYYGFIAGYHTAYNIAYELGFEEGLKAQKTLTYIQAEIKKNNEIP